MNILTSLIASRICLIEQKYRIGGKWLMSCITMKRCERTLVWLGCSYKADHHNYPKCQKCNQYNKRQ